MHAGANDAEIPGERKASKLTDRQSRKGCLGCLEGSRLSQDEALATGEGYFCTVLQHKDIAH